MHAIVLAGGYATRLWPVTKHRPKMLLPVGDTTVIDRILTQLETDPRIDEVYISTNEHFAEDFQTHLSDSELSKPQLSIEETYQEEEKLGVIGALAQLVNREDLGDEDLLVVAGDNLISFDLGEFIDTFEGEEGSLLAAYDIGVKERASQYGVVDLNGTRVVDFEEKPESPSSSLVSIACYAFPAEDIRFAEYLNEGNNPDEPGWFVQWLQNHCPVHAFTFDGAWFDIGTLEGYLDAISWTLKGDTVVASDATVEDTNLGENVHIMSGATVNDSNLDRTVVFPDASVEEASVQASIVDYEATVRDLELTGALVGPHSRLP